MNIAASNPKIQTHRTAPQIATPELQPEVQAERSPNRDLVDRIVDNTYLGANYPASAVGGTLAGGAAWVAQGPKETVKNTAAAVSGLWKTERYGPTLKTLALAATVPAVVAGGVLAAPVTLVTGLFRGAGQVDGDTPRQFTVDKATSHSFDKTSQNLKEISSEFRQGMKELGDYKLSEGEKAIDIPLIKTAKTLAVGALAGAVGGAVGLVSALTAFATETVRGVGSAFGNDELNAGQKLFAATNSVVGAAVHGTSYGVRTGLATFGNALTQTWDKDSVGAGVGSIINNVRDGVAATVAPERVLLEERPLQD